MQLQLFKIFSFVVKLFWLSLHNGMYLVIQTKLSISLSPFSSCLAVFYIHYCQFNHSFTVKLCLQHSLTITDSVTYLCAIQHIPLPKQNFCFEGLSKGFIVTHCVLGFYVICNRCYFTWISTNFITPLLNLDFIMQNLLLNVLQSIIYILEYVCSLLSRFAPPPKSWYLMVVPSRNCLLFCMFLTCKTACSVYSCISH